MRRISLFFIAGIIAITVYVGVNSFESLSTQTEPEVATAQLNFNAYSEGINTVLYDTTGLINYTLQADSQIHFNDDSTELDKPFIQLYENGNSRWNIVAKSGKISSLTSRDISAENSGDTTQTIELSGDIEVYSLDELGNRMQMNTEFLTLSPQTKTMETDQLVTVVTQSMQLTSVGMFADLTADAVVFTREVQGSYDTATP